MKHYLIAKNFLFFFILDMRIESIKSAQYNQSNFQGNKAKMIVEKLSMRNFYAKPDSSEFVALRNIYNNLWKKLDLPENLKPRLQYKAMFANMSFSIENYMINVEKRLSPFKMNVRNKTGQNEATLRHEIEHVRQI